MNVSVVIASYGEGAAWVELADRAEASVRPQEPFEIIRHHLPYGTLAEARNGAAALAQGDFLCHLDADDELAAGYFDAMQDAFVEWDEHHYRGNLPSEGGRHKGIYPNLLLVPRVQYVHENGREDPPVFPNRHEPMDTLNHCVIGTLAPRLLLMQVGGFPELPIYEDWAAFLACHRAGARLVYVEDAVYRAHVRPGSRNQDASVLRATYDRIRQEHLRALQRPTG